MIKIRCEAITDHNRCKNSFRSRVKHQFCRSCHRKLYNQARPIESRETLYGAYRRTRNRRSVSSKPVPKVIANRNKRDKNAIS